MDAKPDPLEETAQLYRYDLPCISDAMKNYCSAFAASGVASAEEKQQVDLGTLLSMAKIVLRLINSFNPSTVEEWTAAHPQREDETAMARIDTITHVKACSQLAHQLRSHGAKLTKMLGRQFLVSTACWDSVEPAARSELIDKQRFPEKLAVAFLNGFGSALQPDVGDADLVWASDFQGALQARRAARSEEVTARRERLETGAAEAEQLRAAMAAGGGDKPDDEMHEVRAKAEQDEGEDEERFVEI